MHTVSMALNKIQITSEWTCSVYQTDSSNEGRIHSTMGSRDMRREGSHMCIYI